MKTSRLGIIMYDGDDNISDTPEAPTVLLGMGLNKLRIEINKIAEILDRITEAPAQSAFTDQKEKSE